MSECANLGMRKGSGSLDSLLCKTWNGLNIVLVQGQNEVSFKKNDKHAIVFSIGYDVKQHSALLIANRLLTASYCIKLCSKT